MDADQSTQLSQCLAVLEQSNQHWWQALAITQTQADELSLAIAKLMIGAICYALVAFILKTA